MRTFDFAGQVLVLELLDVATEEALSVDIDVFMS